MVDAVAQILWIFRSCVSGALPADCFTAKIADIETAASYNKVTSEHRETIAQLSAGLSAADWSGIAASPGHGDLTFRNILVTRGEGVMFVDCDEPFASSYWLDFAKLFEGLERVTAEDGAARERALLAHDLRALAKEASPRLPQRLPQLTALHVFRALPHAGSPEQVDALCRAVSRALSAT